jgi:hypothetical protein
MISLRVLIALLFCMLASCATAAYDAQPKRPINLDGRWILNEAASDDPEKMLRERLEREQERFRREMERWRRSRGPNDRALPPIGEEGVEVPAATRAARARVMRWREREMQLYRRMLAISPTLQIRQDGRRVEITSSVESRTFDAGSSSQVSMPEGQLADRRVGWDGDSFVIQRKVRNGPSVIEEFRLLKKTDQLEYRMAWGGDTELAGMKVRRIYDRNSAPPPVRNPDWGPVR